MKPALWIMAGILTWTAQAADNCQELQGQISRQKEALDQLSSRKITLTRDPPDVTGTVVLEEIRQQIADKEPHAAIAMLQGHLHTVANVLPLLTQARDQYAQYLPMAGQVGELVNGLVHGLQQAVASQCRVEADTLQRWQKLAQEQSAHIQEVTAQSKHLTRLLMQHENLHLSLQGEIKRLQ